ncbi:MAG: ferrous iron transport protein A [Deferribacteraceae bacterium]|jgi:ferrous iron transport protein A|nr:ferrous iron transport protein A [Deferribacteraceae bacterium]
MTIIKHAGSAIKHVDSEIESLRDLQVGEFGEIEGFNAGDNSYKKKLLSLGLTRGTRVKLLRVAPLGDPMEVEVRGFRLSLRKSEAEILKVKKVH